MEGYVRFILLLFKNIEKLEMEDVEDLSSENIGQNMQDDEVDMEDELEDGIANVTNPDEDEVVDDDQDEDEEEEDEEADEEMDEDEDMEEEEDDDDDDDNGNEGGESREDDEDDDDDDGGEENEDGSLTAGKNQSSKDWSEVEDKTARSSDEPVVMSKLDKLQQYYTQLNRSSALADSYTIQPSAAIPIQTNVQCLAMTKGLRYLFLGGSDGYIRKFDFLNTVDGKLSLTIQQKNALVDSIVNAGILLSYWENEVPQPASKVKWLRQKTEYVPVVSPVHSLAVQNECLYILAGQESGGIVMQGVRYLEGSIAHYFKGHHGIVNHLVLNDTETQFLSGSWDKTVREWDLETGTQLQTFKASSQLSSLEFRPLGAKLVLAEPQQDGDDNSLFGEEDDEELEKPMQEDDEIISKQTLALRTDQNVFLTSCIDGNIQVWDKRQASSSNILKLGRSIGTPPWCMSACWSSDGEKIIAGRRNATVEVYDLRKPDNFESKLKLPSISGPVSCVKSMPNNRHVIAASNDNIRIFDLHKMEKTPLIIPGHHGGCISNLYIDPTCRFMISTSGNRGWQGNSTDVTLIYDIDLH